MNIESLRDLELVVTKAQRLSQLLHDLKPRINRNATAPLPVPLTLSALEQWLEGAEEAIKRPRISESKKLLSRVGIETASIPSNVLSEVEQIKVVLEGLSTLPNQTLGQSKTIIGHALAKGVSDAGEAMYTLRDLGVALGPVLELNEQWPEQVAVILQALPDSTADFPSYLKKALALHEHLKQLGQFGIVSSEPVTTMAELENDLARFNKAHRELQEVLSREGLIGKNMLALKERNLAHATEDCDRRRIEIMKEKSALSDKYDSLSKRLKAMGVESENSPQATSELLDAVSGIEKQIAARHKQLAGTLGPAAVIVVESVMSGRLPSNEELDDYQLGQAIRRAVNAGFQIRIEAPIEGN